MGNHGGLSSVASSLRCEMTSARLCYCAHREKAMCSDRPARSLCAAVIGG